MNLLKYFAPKVVETISSPINGDIKVMKDFNTYYLATGFWTQSGGLINELWAPTLAKIHPKKNSSWLILGLSGGTAAQIISHKYSPSKIVGVELDSNMIDLGKKYLKLDQIPGLEILTQDAHKYVRNTQLKFDYILVDMYLGDTPPEFLYSQKFLIQLKKIGKSIIINHLFYTSTHKQNAEKIVNQLEKTFSQVQLFRKLTNLMIICD